MLKIGPEAFADESEDQEEIEVDLEDVIKEELLINKIHEALKNEACVTELVQDLWEFTHRKGINQSMLFESGNVK